MPYARATAEVSLKMRRQLRLAILHAASSAWRWQSLNWTGTPTTQSPTLLPSSFSAELLSWVRSMAVIWTMENSLSSFRWLHVNPTVPSAIFFGR